MPPAAGATRKKYWARAPPPDHDHENPAPTQFPRAQLVAAPLGPRPAASGAGPASLPGRDYVASRARVGGGGRRGQGADDNSTTLAGVGDSPGQLAPGPRNCYVLHPRLLTLAYVGTIFSHSRNTNESVCSLCLVSAFRASQRPAPAGSASASSAHTRARPAHSSIYRIRRQWPVVV